MSFISKVKEDKVYVITILFVLAVVLIADILPNDVDFSRSRIKTKSKIQRKLEEILKYFSDLLEQITNNKQNTEKATVAAAAINNETTDNNISAVIENPIEPQESTSEKIVEPLSIAEQHIIYYADGTIAEERTIENIRDYVHNTMTYKFNHWPQNLDTIEKTKTGDCSDYSTLIKSMCEEVGIKGIEKAHGYIKVNGIDEKHDWLVHNGTIIDGIGDFGEYQYLGAGYW